MNTQQVNTGKGLPNDIAESVLRLCQQAFQEDLRFEEAPRDVATGDISKARLTDLPAMRVWTYGFEEDVNQTGAALGRKQREKLTLHTMVVYCVDFATPREGNDVVTTVGWFLREKLAENMTLFGLSNMGGSISVEYGPDIANVNDELAVVDCVKITISYELVRMKKRATPQ